MDTFSTRSNRSCEDITVKKDPISEQRPRSTSPRKKPPPLASPTLEKSLPSIPVVDGTSIPNNSATFTDQWRELSHSPIAKKLHIADSPNYIIPIPFTLQLPPKLSAKNVASSTQVQPTTPGSSPERTPKPVRLIYTGTGYEKLEGCDEDPFLVPDSPTPRKKSKVLQPLPRRPPPPVARNKAKSPKKIIVQRLIDSDELSIIEEKDSENSSRQSSVKSKKLLSKTRKIDFKSIGENTTEENETLAAPILFSSKSNTLSKSMDSTIQNDYEAPQFFPVDPVKDDKLVNSSHLKLANNNQEHWQRKSAEPRFENYTHSTVHSNREYKRASGPLILNLNEKPLPTRSSNPTSPFNNDKSSSAPSMDVYRSPVNDTTTATVFANQESQKLKEMHSYNDNRVAIQQSNFSGYSYISPVSSPEKKEIIQHQAPRDVDSNIIRNSINISTISGRISSESSITTEDSEISANSWDSLQKSVDITIGDRDNETILDSDESYSAEKTLTKQITNESDWVDSVGENELILRTSPLRVNKIETEKGYDSERYFEDSLIAAYCNNDMDTSHLHEPMEPLPENNTQEKVINAEKYVDIKEKSVIQDNDGEQTMQKPKLQVELSDSENEGIGKSFDFPNNFNNITNSKEMKARSFGSTRSRASRQSFFSSNGQIEIPDLSDRSVARSYTTFTSHNSTTFDDVCSESSASTAVELEPIGTLSKAARLVLQEHLDAVYEDGNSDTDIETASLTIGTPRSKSTPNLALDQRKQTAAPSARRSPVRHARHKSLHSIDFNAKDFLNKPMPALPIKSTNIPPTPAKEDKELGERIVVAPTPVQVNYAVDFVESNVKDIHNKQPEEVNFNKNDHVMRMLSKQLRNASLNRHSVPNPQLSKETLSRSSRSSYQSSRSSRPDPPTSVSDQDDKDSVIIDLTKDKYVETTIHRNNSCLSYKSITEKTKDGKEVEVVLVEDEEDLLSIYSKYRRMQVLRSNSTQSSNVSSVSLFNSMASSQQLNLKQRSKSFAFDRQMPTSAIVQAATNRLKPTASTSSSSSSTSYNYRRIKPPTMNKTFAPLAEETQLKAPLDKSKRHSNPIDSNYFDYSKQEKYDFDSFIKNQNTLPNPTY